MLRSPYFLSAAGAIVGAVSAVAAAGCLQDFDQFSPTGGGGNAASGSTTTSSQSSSSGSNSSSSGSGTCNPPNCNDDDPCTTDTCNGSTCAHDTLPNGTPVPGGNLDPADCKQPVCMNGTPTDAPLDTEMPSDGNDCTSDACVSGMPTFSDLPNGTKCGAGMMFDCFGGDCGCNSPTDCGANDECGTRTCSGGGNKVCGWDYTNAGTNSMTQTTGDCRKRVCNGNSEVADVVPDDDPANDNLPCTLDDCDGQLMTTHDPLPAGTACGSGDECGGGNQAGTCCSPASDVCAGKECGMLTDSCNVMKACGTCMSPTPACVSNQCEECSPSGTECMSNPIGHACITGNVCGCTTGSDCGAGTKCDTAMSSPKKNKCVECLTNTDCAAPTPVCDTDPGHATFETCIGCAMDTDCMGTPATPLCGTGTALGTCVKCNSDPDCAGIPPVKCKADHTCQ